MRTYAYVRTRPRGVRRHAFVEFRPFPTSRVGSTHCVILPLYGGCSTTHRASGTDWYHCLFKWSVVTTLESKQLKLSFERKKMRFLKTCLLIILFIALIHFYLKMKSPTFSKETLVKIGKKHAGNSFHAILLIAILPCFAPHSNELLMYIDNQEVACVMLL